MTRGLSLLVLIGIATGCGLMNSGDDSDAKKAEQALNSATTPSTIPSPPTFVVEVPAASASPTSAPGKVGLEVARVAAQNAGGARATSSRAGTTATVTVASSGQGGARTTSATPTTVAAATNTGAATAGLLSVGTRTQANSVTTATQTSTSTGVTTRTTTATTAAPTTTAATTTAPSTSRRRPNVFSGSGLLSGGGGTASRGNRQVVAPTRSGAQ